MRAARHKPRIASHFTTRATSTCEPRLARDDFVQRFADLAQCAPGSGRGDTRHALALDHEGAGEDEWGPVATGATHAGFLDRTALADRDRLARQQRLVDREVHGVEHDPIGRHAVPFGEQDDVLAHDLAPGNPALHAVPNHERSRARQIAQRSERALRLALLIERDADDEHHEHEEQHRVLDPRRLLQADEEIDRAGSDEQQQHRLADHRERDLQQVARLGRRDLVRPLGDEPLDRVGLAQAGDGPEIERFAHHAAFTGSWSLRSS